MKSQTKIRFQLTNSFSSSTHSRFSQRGSWQQSEDHQSVRGLFAEGSSTSQPLSSNLQRAAIIQTRAWMLCFWLARVRHFPLWPIMLAFLLLSCGILGGGISVFLPPPPFCSQNAYELAVQKIQSSYVKDKSKQTSKGRDEEACCIQRLQTLLSALRPPAPAKRTQPLGTKPGPEPGLWFQGSWHCSFSALFVLMELRCVANRDPCSPPCLHEAAHTVIHADKAKLP